MENRGGQITIFVIIAIILVVVILLFFVLRGDILPSVFTKPEVNPVAYLESCLEEEVFDFTHSVNMIGGFVPDNSRRSLPFLDDDGVTYDIAYYCYAGINGEKCSNLYPLLKEELENEIHRELYNKVKNCVDTRLEQSYVKSGYGVESEPMRNFEVVLTPTGIEFNIDKELVLSKGGEATTHTGFNIIFNSEWYNFVNVARDIVNAEASEGDFDSFEYMRYHSGIIIRKFVTPESKSKIYTLSIPDSDEKFQFAVRGNV